MTNNKARSGPSDRERHLLKIISTVEGYSKPNQDRSSRKTHAIIAAAISLLEERSAETIRMQDIADRAGCAVTAIYSRFADRDTLFSALHMVALQECRPLLDERIALDKLKETGIEGLARAFLSVNDFYFDKNFNFIAAQLRSQADYPYKVTHEIMDAYARRLAKVASSLLDMESDALIEPLKLTIHVVLAIYRDSVLGRQYFERPSQTVLVNVFVSVLQQAIGALARDASPRPEGQPAKNGKF